MPTPSAGVSPLFVRTITAAALSFISSVKFSGFTKVSSFKTMSPTAAFEKSVLPLTVFVLLLPSVVLSPPEEGCWHPASKAANAIAAKTAINLCFFIKNSS